MNVGFEAKRLFSNFTGLGNYSRFIVDALSTHYHEDSFFLYTPSVKQHPEVNEIIHRENVNVISPKGLFSQPGFSAVWRSWALTRQPSIQKLSVFHGLSQELPIGLPRHVKKVVTVHDLIFLRYPGFYKPIDISIYKRKVKQACAAADCIIAISRQTAEDIQSILSVEFGPKIKIVYQGVHPNFSSRKTERELMAVSLKYKLPSRFMLNVGTIEERKNLLTLIKALAIIPESSRLPLVVIGRKTNYYSLIEEQIKALGLQKYVTVLSDVAFADFPAIYQKATLFVYPSLFEGFGIPVVEAMKSGVPVITSTGSCFSEAGGPSTIYVHPESPEGLAEKILLLTGDEELRQQMSKVGQAYIQKFAPEAIAKDLHNVYESLS
jgi:glycosyltransferase involved in cell wall biosynthesis